MRPRRVLADWVFDFATHALRVASRKSGVWPPSRFEVRRRLVRSMIVQSLGCSIGCSSSQGVDPAGHCSPRMTRRDLCPGTVEIPLGCAATVTHPEETAVPSSTPNGRGTSVGRGAGCR
jgi:hypothetical protein